MDQEKETKIEEITGICEIMKEDTSEILRKMESQIPMLFQNYSNLYTQYLHMLDDIFGTCYIAEKELFDRLNIDQKSLYNIKKISNTIKKSYLESIDKSAQLFDQYTKFRIESIKVFDSYMHVMMESYANMLSEFNKASK